MIEEWEYADLVGKLDETGISLEGLKNLKKLPISVDEAIDLQNRGRSVNKLKKAEARHFIRRFAQKILKFYDKYPWADDMVFSGNHIGTNNLSVPKTSTTATIIAILPLGNKRTFTIYIDRVRFTQYHRMESISGSIMSVDDIDVRRRLRQEFNLHQSARLIYLLK